MSLWTLTLFVDSCGQFCQKSARVETIDKKLRQKCPRLSTLAATVHYRVTP